MLYLRENDAKFLIRSEEKKRGRERGRAAVVT